MVSARVGIFICTFTPKQGRFLNFATHFPFRCLPVVLFPSLGIIEMQHIVLSIRYTTEITKKEPVYLVNLATCILLAAEVTSHPHFGGDDNATIFRTTETVHREPHI